MTWTKRELIDLAFEELGLAGFVYDIEPEQLRSALKRMDIIVGAWEADGISIGYPLGSDPDTKTLSEAVALPEYAIQALCLQLALSLAPTFGKKVSPQTKINAHRAYLRLLNARTKPIQQQFPSTLPVGSGNRSRGTRRVYVQRPTYDPLRVGTDGNLNFLE